jgi:hypothetical protein
MVAVEIRIAQPPTTQCDGNVSYPNEEDTDQKRTVSLTNDDLKVLIALGDGGKIELVYRRAKLKPD